MEPWMGQLGAAGVLGALLLFLGRAFVGSIDRRVGEISAAHTAELERLTKQHERELGDMRQRAAGWEQTAERRDTQIQELWALNGKLQAGNDTAVQVLGALRRFADERTLGAG